MVILRKFSLPFALANSSWYISTRFSFWSISQQTRHEFCTDATPWSFSLKIWWQDPILILTSSATSRKVKRRFPRITARTLYLVVICWRGSSSKSGIFTDRHSALFKTLKPLIALRSAHTVLPVCLVKHLKCLCKIFTKSTAKFHTHTHTHTLSSSSFIVTLSLIRQTACTVHVRSSADVARWLMLIAKRDTWQFVLKTWR